MFGIADDTLILGNDDNDMVYNNTVRRVLQISREVNLKLYKDKCHIICSSVPFFGKIISKHGMRPDPRKLKASMEMPSPATKKGIASILCNN